MKTLSLHNQVVFRIVLFLGLLELSEFPVMAAPDLRGYGNAYPFDLQTNAANWGDAVPIQFNVANYGSTVAGAFTVGIFISTNTIIGDASDYQISSVTYTGLAASSYSARSGTILLPSVNPLAGQPTAIYFGMVVDVTEQVAESDENNNKNLGNGIDRDDTPVTITPPIPDVFATDSTSPYNDLTVAFSNVAHDGVGNARGVQTITLLNKGKASLTVSNLVLTGSTNFALTQIASSIQNFIQPSSLPRVIASKGTECWVLTMEFDPTSTNAQSGTLTVKSNDPDTPNLALSLTGTGVPVPDIALTTPEAVETDFGSVVQDGAGGYSSTRTITLKNVGTGPLTIIQNGISMLTGTHYSFLSITSSTRGAISLAAGSNTIAAASAETWDVQVRFDPSVVGQLNDGLRVLSNDPDESSFIVSLRGRGASPMQLAVTDSQGSPTDHSIAFPGVHADGAGKESAVANVTLQNMGEAPLMVASNGITLTTGTQFSLQGIVSDVQGAINLATGAAQLAGSTSETWTVTVVFDPSTAGALSDTLTIQSDDLASPTVQVAISGQGVDRPAISLTDSVAPANDLTVGFGAALNDGAGGRVATQTLTLNNLGTLPLVISQNGLVLGGSPAFSVTGVLSSVDGQVDIGSALDADRTIAPTQAETWTVSLAFDPPTNGAMAGTLSINSNDPSNSTVVVSMTGTGAVPTITLTDPSENLNVSAGSVFDIKWQDSYPAGDAAIALWLDNDTNATDGLIPVADGLSEDDTANAYAWRVSETLTGGQYYVYATIADGSVTNGSYAPGRLTVDPLGSFKLRSAVEVTSPDYAYEYEYNGQVYQGVTHLQMGDNVVTVSNPIEGGGTATFQFTVRLVPSLIHAETVAHDELNRIEKIKNGNGIETRLIYDQMNRLVRRESDNGAVVQYGYDVLGRRTNMVDAVGTTFYEWDDLNRLTAVITSKNGIKGDSDDLPLRYEYDLAGRKTAIIYPGGERTEYTYDNAGRMLTVNNVTRSLLFTYTYNATNGLLNKLTRPNGIDTLYAYDGMGRLTNILHQKTGGELVANFGYTLDAAGKATAFRTTETGGVERVEQYAYDRFDRLSEVIYSDDGVVDINDKTVSHTYDGNGNRLAMTTLVNNAVNEVRLYQYGNENRLLRVTDGEGTVLTEYGYDAAGNMIQETSAERTRFFSYDERNLLVGVVDGTNHITYAYNGDGQRIAKTLNGGRTTHVLDGNRGLVMVVQERDAAGEIDASHTLGGQRLGSFERGALLFELCDRLGSVRYLTESNAAAAGYSSYDAFGAGMAMSGRPSRYGFVGERFDEETRLVFLRARYYLPTLGRFTTRDPLGIAPGLNTYLYCNADPVNHVDSSGLDDSGSLLGPDYDWVYVHGIRSDMEDAQAGARSLGLNPDDPRGLVISPFRPDDGFGSVIAQSLETAAYASGLMVPAGFDQLSGKSVGTIYTFSGGGAAMRSAEQQYGFTYDRWVSSASVLGPNGFTEWFSNPTHGDSISGRGIDLLVGSVIPRVVTYGTDAAGNQQNLLGAGITVKGDTALGALGNFVGGIGRAICNFFRIPEAEAAEVNVGGVLIDKAAQLVGSNLSDIRGAVYDPITGQFVFLGTEGAAGVKDIDLDYLYTALQAVYGSAVPPFVTLDPPATIRGQWNDLGDCDGVFEPGEKGGFLLRYTVKWSGEDHEIRIMFRTGGSWYTIVMDAVQASNIYIGGQKAMYLLFNRWDGAAPSGVSWVAPTGGVWLNGIYFGTSVSATDGQQDTFYPIILQNSGAQNHVIEDLSVRSDRQHRKFGGRVENTRLGWVMLEADRVMKCLAVGRDNLLTNITYNSGTVSVPGYSNMTQRGGTGNIRMWFTPNEMTLKRHLDPLTGRASIVFDKASVALNTESFMMGLPQPPEARAFADHFTSNYDAFAAIDFPCVDPNDPAGTNVIQVKIFERLREAMQAVSLARFFRDNNVPVDMWWLNSWTPPVAYSPKSTPTAYNEENGMIIYGGVQVNKPNTYVPSATAKSVADVVQASHPDVAGNPGGDIKEQIWTNNTSEGMLKAVAAQTDAEPQDGNIRLAETDLSFASPGAMPLQFTRFYHGSWMGGMKMGPGWRYTPFVLEFERPSWMDENSLMRNGTNAVWKDTGKDTRLRSGGLRVVDLRSGATLDFTSSLVLGYALDNIGNAVITVSGLSGAGLPTFTPGLRQSGATLAQTTNECRYVFSTPDGATITFDHEGRLLQTLDRYAKAQTYAYDSPGNLTNIADMAGQKLVLGYNSGTSRVVSITGPAGEQVTYAYNATGCLASATHVRSGASTTYTYNENRQLVKKTMFNGLTAVQSDPDLKGRAEESSDLRSNAVVSTFTQDAAGSVRTTETTDPLVTDPAFQPQRKQFDREGRLLTAEGATGAETIYGYDSGSLLPNVVDLPIAGRPAITIERNAYGQPTQISDPGNIGAQDATATYDPTTKLLQQTSDQAGRNMEMTYNTNRGVARVRRHLGGQDVDVAYSYTTNGALFAMTNALGIRAVTIYRDSVDRATNVVDATGISTRYQYDSLGRLWKVYDPRMSGPVEYVYDNFDRVIEIKYPVGSVYYEYDAVKGWLTRQTDILGRSTHYMRDPNTGDILEVVDEVSGGTDRTTELAYNRFGQMTNITPPDAQAISFNYDDLGRPLGSSEKDAAAPGAPKALDSDQADHGVPTFSTNHLFTWGAPDTDSGVAGYSIGHDQGADEIVDTVGATSVWAGVAVGIHTVSVRAVANNGLGGPEATFVLIVRPMTEYDQWRVGHFTPSEADNNAISGPTVDYDEDGMINEREYVADTDPKDPESLLRITGVHPEVSEARVYWKGGQQAIQTLEYRARLDSGSWVGTFTNNPPTAIETNVLDYIGEEASRFYRIKATR